VNSGVARKAIHQSLITIHIAHQSMPSRYRPPVKRSDRQLKVLLSRVLDFVVTNAAEALDEHHDRGNAEASDGGGGDLMPPLHR
jgi:hypothetical protein